MGLRTIAANIFGLYFEWIVLMIPLVALLLPAARKLKTSTKALAAAASVAVALVLVLTPVFRPRVPLLPFDYFGGNIVTQYGVLASNVEVLGDKPRILNPPLQIATIAVAFYLQLICLLLVGPKVKTWIAESGGRWRTWLWDHSGASRIQGICLLFLLPYVGAVLSRAIVGQAIDRYLLPLLALGGLIALSGGTGGLKRIPVAAFALTVVFSLYGIATTHDYFACSRARLAAAEELEANQVPRAEITAGLEFDGWTEISASGYINDPRITVPLNAYRPQNGRSYVLSEPYWFWPFTPSVQPKYYVVLSEQPGLRPSGVAPFQFFTWLPPRVRRVIVQTTSLDRAEQF